MGQARRIQAIAAEIEAYLERHPQAADTLEGIRDWWLSSRSGSPEEIQRALERLIRRGRVEKYRLANGRILFRRPKSGQT
ncbi:hypothetical protein [Methylothermus subterraneus]